MVIKIFPGFRWVLLRFSYHLAAIALMFFLVFLLIENLLYISLVGFGLILLYIGIVYVQIKTPLVSFDGETFIISNFFYRGQKKVSKNEIVSIDVRDKVIINLANNAAIKINFQGMDKRRLIEAKDKLKNILKYESIG